MPHKVSRQAIASAIARQSLSAGDPSKLSMEVAAYLLSERRVGELDSLLRDVMQYRADNGIVEVVAASAHQLAESTRADIAAQVRSIYPNAKQIIISHRLDHDVLGGVRLEMPHAQLDMSVRSKLSRLKQLTAIS